MDRVRASPIQVISIFRVARSRCLELRLIGVPGRRRTRLDVLNVISISLKAKPGQAGSLSYIHTMDLRLHLLF